MIEIPEDLLHQSHFSRYFHVWKDNEASIVFVPLAEICRRQGYFDQAQQICERGLKFNPYSVSGRLTLARIFSDRDQEEMALPILEALLGDYPGHKEALDLYHRLSPGSRQTDISPWETCTMAKILADQGDKKAALEIVQKILSRNPTDLRATELKEVLCRQES